MLDSSTKHTWYIVMMRMPGIIRAMHIIEYNACDAYATQYDACNAVPSRRESIVKHGVLD